MHPVRVVVICECVQLTRQVDRVPEEYAVEIFAADRADQPFDERMRNWRVWSRLDLLDREDPKVGEPAVKAKQRIVIRTDVLGQTLARAGAIEHPACGDAINGAGFDAEADDASSENVHHYHHPMAA